MTYEHVTVVQGMKYLHDSVVKSHGRLRSACCFIDSRWVLKIENVGLHWLRHTDVESVTNLHQSQEQSK